MASQRVGRVGRARRVVTVRMLEEDIARIDALSGLDRTHPFATRAHRVLRRLVDPGAPVEPGGPPSAPPRPGTRAAPCAAGPLSDRILAQLTRGPQSARHLARALGADVHHVHAVLRALRAAGAVEKAPQYGDRFCWRLTGQGTAPLAGPGCRAMTSRASRPCRVEAVPGELCYIHAPRGEGLAEA